MTQAKIMVLCASRSDQRIIVRRIREVLVNPEFVRSRSVKQASLAFGKTLVDFSLLVVDIHAPVESRRKGDAGGWIEGSVGEGGYEFVKKYVLTRGYPPPPILLISRLRDFLPKEEWSGSFRMEGVRVDELDIGHFTTEALDRVCRKFGIATQLIWPPLFDNKKLQTGPAAEAPPDEYVRSKLQSYFLEIYRGEGERGRRQRVWEIVRRIDDSLMKGANREAVFADEKVIRVINEWHHRLLLELEPEGQWESRRQSSDWRDEESRYHAWFHMLQADLLWNSQPVDSLYSLMKAIDLNLEANVEPLGGPGDPAYRIALRLNADQKRWPRIRAWLVQSRFGKMAVMFQRRLTHGSANYEIAHKVKKAKTFDFGYSENIWQDVIRFQVSKATKELKRSPAALLAIENRLTELSGALQKKGRARAADELEARSCEVRKERLNWLRKSIYKLLGLVCDYGNRPDRLALCCIFLVCSFALLYYPMPESWAKHWWAPLTIRYNKEWPYVRNAGFYGVLKNWVTAMYFSTVTFVTLGYGDITPMNTFGKVVAAAEAVFGFSTFGLAIAVGSTRLRPR